MARKNRIVVEDGTYHLVSRIAHREFLLADPLLKDLVVDWMYGIADFCGIEVLAWNILDNHFHIEVEMPQVPKEYWTDPDHAPEVAAFSLRPPDCRLPVGGHRCGTSSVRFEGNACTDDMRPECVSPAESE